MINIEEYRDEYRDQIIDFILNIQNNEFKLGLTIDDQRDLLDITHYYKRDHGNFWVALSNRTVIGTVSLLDITNNQVALRKLFVNAEYRGSEYQVAHLLVRKAVQWSQSKGKEDIYLGTTSRYHAAHRFYEKNGFIEIEKADLPGTFPIMRVDTKFYSYRL